MLILIAILMLMLMLRMVGQCLKVAIAERCHATIDHDRAPNHAPIRDQQPKDDGRGGGGGVGGGAGESGGRGGGGGGGEVGCRMVVHRVATHVVESESDTACCDSHANSALDSTLDALALLVLVVLSPTLRQCHVRACRQQVHAAARRH
jgi:hypothetical protein